MNFDLLYFLFLIIPTAHLFLYQIKTFNLNDPNTCLKIFKNNNYFDGCFSNHLSNLKLPDYENIHIDYITTYTDNSYSRYDLEFDFTNGNVISKLNNLVMHMIQKKQNLDYLLFVERMKNSNNISLNKYYIIKNEKLLLLKDINFYDFNKDIFLSIYDLDYRMEKII